MKYSLGTSNFLEETSSLHHSIFSLYFALITEEDFLISPCYSLELCIQMGEFEFPFLLCFSLPFFSQLFVRPPQTVILLFCISFLGDGLDFCLPFPLFIIYLAALGLSSSTRSLVAVCGILVPRPGIKHRPPALGAWSLSHWTTRKVPVMFAFHTDPLLKGDSSWLISEIPVPPHTWNTMGIQ